MRRVNYDPALPRGNSSYFNPTIIELDRNIGHKSVMSICEFFVGSDKPSHLVNQVIHDMEGIGYECDEGANGMYQLFAEALSFD